MTASTRLAAALALAAGLFASLPAAAQTVPGRATAATPNMRADAGAITAALRKRDAMAVTHSEVIGRLREARPQSALRLADAQPRASPRPRTR
jgi:uncharacterized protein (DUF2141 family)